VWSVGTLLYVLPALWAEPRVYVEPTDLAAAMVSALAAELSADGLVDSKDAANFFVSLTPHDDVAFLELRLPNGNKVLERSITTDGGVDAAVRVAVLLVARAIRALAAERSGPTESFVETSSASRGSLDPGPSATVAMESQPATAKLALAPLLGVDTWAGQPQFSLGILAELGDRIRPGLEFVSSGLLCCAQSTKGIEASAVEYALTADLTWRFVDDSNWALAGVLAAGVQVSAGQATATGFAGPASPRSFSFVQGVGRAGILVQRALSEELAVSIRGGIHLAAGPAEIHAPDPIGSGTQTLRTALFSPWAQLGVAWTIF
jgi:hypothetical protein